MLSILNTAVQFTAGYLLADAAISTTKKARHQKHRRNCACTCHKLNYRHLFAV